ncbi:hydroxysqualene dehydroxylase [Rhodococcus olei]|uniref:hydroxysqualene dehydroxylase n=1 Tax=Rhodococcus olei TaxID=2161675 RepID=UPI0031EE3429
MRSTRSLLRWARATRPVSRRTVAVFGAGVAGLTAAHELAERGFAVTVYERKAIGGRARSTPPPGLDVALPAERGLRIRPGLDRNLTETMRRIPFPGNPNGCDDNLTSASSHRHTAVISGCRDRLPITPTEFIGAVAGVLGESGLSPGEASFAARKLGVYATSCEERRLGQWEYASWGDYVRIEGSSPAYRRVVADGLIRHLTPLRSGEVSAHSVGVVAESSVWSGMTTGRHDDRVLNGPASERWLEPWARHLRRLGVRFEVGWELSAFDTEGRDVVAATVTDRAGGRRTVESDWYVSAIPVDKFNNVLTDRMISTDSGLAGVRRLRTRWSSALQFYLREPVPATTGPVHHLDSPWALTSVSPARFWPGGMTRYGDGTVQDCLSTIVSDWSSPGMFDKRPAKACTPAEIAAETWAQVKAHLVEQGTVLRDEMLHSWRLDPAVIGSGTSGAYHDEPTFVPGPGSWSNRPASATGFGNLFLAGDWVRTDVNVASLEGANEAGRRAVNALLGAAGAGSPVAVHEPVRPAWADPFRVIDRGRYRSGLRNVFDVTDTRASG